MHSRYTWIRWRKNKCKKKKLHSQQTGPGIILESAPQNTILCLFTETKWHFDRHSTVSWLLFDQWCSWLYSSDLLRLFCHCEMWVFHYYYCTSTREIQLCARPETQLTCSPLLPADFTCQSTAHAWKSKWKGSNCYCYFPSFIFIVNFWTTLTV